MEDIKINGLYDFYMRYYIIQGTPPGANERDINKEYFKLYEQAEKEGKSMVLLKRRVR